MREIREKSSKSTTRIYKMIEERMKTHAVNKETAAYLLAMEHDINISRYLGEEQLKQVREVRSPIIIRKASLTQQAQHPISVNIEPVVKITIPNIPKKIINEAQKMSYAYPYVYLFENSARFLIVNVLQQHGNNWWNEKASSDAIRNAQNRKDKEQVNRWHAKRGSHPIFYTDMHDLYSIIVKNWDDFKDIFPNQTWVKSRFDEIELARNIVAHNNPLPNDEITRLKLDLKSWVKQISKTEE